MYYYLQLVAACFISFASAEFAQDNPNSNFIYDPRSHGYLAKPGKNLPQHTSNNTYFEQPDNMLRLPVSQYNRELQSRNHLIKKSPKSTIQKIIKKNRKNKKVFLNNQVTSRPTHAPIKKEVINDAFIPGDDHKENFIVTTQAAQKQKLKRWNPKLPRNPTLFQRMSYHKRMRRGVERDNTLILEDFDEMEFLDKKKDGDVVVKTHAKKYW